MKNQTNYIIPVLAAVIFDSDGRVLIAQRKPKLHQELKWEFPGGKLKPTESPENCLTREIKEELGIKISIQRLFSAVNFSYSEKNIILLAYISKFVSGDFTLSDHQEVRWVPIKQLSNFDLSPADIPIVEKLIKNFKKISAH